MAAENGGEGGGRIAHLYMCAIQLSQISSVFETTKKTALLLILQLMLPVHILPFFCNSPFRINEFLNQLSSKRQGSRGGGGGGGGGGMGEYGRQLVPEG